MRGPRSCSRNRFQFDEGGCETQLDTLRSDLGRYGRKEKKRESKLKPLIPARSRPLYVSFTRSKHGRIGVSDENYYHSETIVMDLHIKRLVMWKTLAYIL